MIKSSEFILGCTESGLLADHQPTKRTLQKVFFVSQFLFVCFY